MIQNRSPLLDHDPKEVGRESNRTFRMGALFDGPYRAIAKTGLRPVLTIRPLTP